MPRAIGGVWLVRGTQNNGEPARQMERDEKEVRKRKAKGGSSARPKKSRGDRKKNKSKRNEDKGREESTRRPPAQAFT